MVSPFPATLDQIPKKPRFFQENPGSGAVCPLHDFVILSVAVFQA
jgi:hypothetical protein